MNTNLLLVLFDAKVEEINCLANYFEVKNELSIIYLNELRTEFLSENPHNFKIDKLLENVNKNTKSLISGKTVNGKIIFQKISEAEAMGALIFIDLWA